MSETVQLVIVLAVVAAAAVGFIMKLIGKSNTKKTGCHSCPLNCGCKKDCTPERRDSSCHHQRRH